MKPKKEFGTASVRLFSEHPVAELIRALYDTVAFDKTTSMASFLRKYGKHFAGLSPGWYNPPRNFAALAKKKGVGALELIALVEISYCCGVTVEIYTDDIHPPLVIPSGDPVHFLETNSPEHYLLNARSAIRAHVVRSLGAAGERRHAKKLLKPKEL